MKQFAITVAGVFAGLLLFFVGVPLVLIGLVASAARPAPTPDKSVLSLDLRRPLTDQEGSSPFAVFGGGSRSLLGAVEALHAAARDGRVKGLLIRLPEGGMAPATADELRLAVRDFRAQGKPVIAHSQGLYPGGVVTASYMLGAASGDYWMQPEASLQATGLSNEELFFKRAFDKYGVKADYEQRYEFKNAVNPYLYDDFTPAHRQAELGWLTSVYERELGQAAADRRMDAPTLRRTLETGPWSAQDAAAHGLIDHVGQVLDAEAQLKTRAGLMQTSSLTDLFAYRPGAVARPAASGGSVALIGAEGAIVTGTGESAGFSQSAQVYSDDVARAFAQATADRNVRAIVFRVSSPGGSDTASEQILAGVRAARAAGKPVVVSMGAYAASGGYWISSQASEIVAQPTTLTGSIGVFGGKFVLGPALAKFGVDARDLSVGGEYAAAFGTGRAFTPAQRAAFAGWMDRIYAGFVGRVAAGRKLPEARVREIARGRVWTGEQALKLGLVDKLGGFYDAVREAERLGGLPVDRPARITVLPVRRSPFEAIQRALGVSAVSVRTLAAAAWVMGDPRAQRILDDMARARLQTDGHAPVLAETPGW